MGNFPRLSAEDNIDMESECLYRYIYGGNDIFNPHCHDFYEIFLTVSGTVMHWLNGNIHALPEGSLVFIRPEDTHGYRYDSADSNETTYVNLTFTKNTACKLFDYLEEGFPAEQLINAKNPPMVLLTKTEKRRLIRSLDELNSVKYRDKKAIKMRVRVILADIFSRFFADFQDNTDHEIPIWLSALLSEMSSPENFRLGTKRMVEISQKSREHLSRSLKKYVGLTLSEYVNDLRINYASNLLINTNAPVLDICFESGFQNVSHFYRLFNIKQKLSPRDFRKKYQIDYPHNHS